MANQLIASIYSINDKSTGTSAGTPWGFPTQGIVIRPANPGSTFNGVTINSIIQMLPAGTKVAQDQYGSAATVATLITASNA